VSACTVRRLAYNGEAAWRRRGGHNRLLEPQTVNSTQKVIRSYTPACAKPLVSRWHLFVSIRKSQYASSNFRK